MLDDFDIDFIVDDDETEESIFYSEMDFAMSRNIAQNDLEPDEESVKTDNLIYDALHNSLTHLEKYDLDHCFKGENPEYFEADTIAEIEEYFKKFKIKALLIFVSGNPLMSEVQEAVDAIKPYCTAECMNDKFLFGCTEESEDIVGVARYRMLLALEKQPQQPQQPQPQADSQKTDSQDADNEFGEDIPF